jgi:hypothetical protein
VALGLRVLRKVCSGAFSTGIEGRVGKWGQNRPGRLGEKTACSRDADQRSKLNRMQDNLWLSRNNAECGAAGGGQTQNGTGFGLPTQAR